MKRSRGSPAAFLLLIAAKAAAWGPVGHSEVNVDAIDGLPSPLYEFFDARAVVLDDHASDPDAWKARNASEGPNHYIDIDALAPFPFQDFPTDLDEAYRRFGEDAVAANGFLPWRIAEYVDKLTEDFRDGRWSRAPLTAAALGHYVGDLHQPLHTTKNHDGDLTGNKGVHLRFEDDMVERFQESFDIRVEKAVYVKDPVAFALEAVRSGYPGVDLIMKADKAAEKAAGNDDDLYYRKLYEGTWGLVSDRVSKASSALASLIYTAWVDAGKPVPPK